MNWKDLTLFLVTAALLIVCGLMVLPFLPAITGAIVLATVTARPYDWLKARLGSAALTATVALILVILSVILPLTLVVAGVGQEAMGLVHAVQDGSAEQAVTNLLDEHPGIGNALEKAAMKVDLGNATQRAGDFLAPRLGGLLSDSLSAIIQIVILLFILFFLYRDREFALRAIRRLMPLEDAEIDRLMVLIRNTINATFLGRLAVAAAQGGLAGLAYWTLGVPGALLWTLVTMAVAFIPGPGALIVWLPVAIYLGLTDHMIKALLMAGWGGLVVGSADNILFPIFVGSRMNQHTVSITIAVLGGLLVFGISGLVVGPVLLTIAQSLLQIWRERLGISGHDAILVDEAP